MIRNLLRSIGGFMVQNLILYGKIFATIPYISLILIIGCGIDVEDPDPPSSPHWVDQSSPEAWPERGADAQEGGVIFLEWSENPEDDIRGYHLYRTRYFTIEDSLGEMEELAYFEADELSETVYSDQTADLLIVYHYCIKAEDGSQNMSEPSDTLQYRLLQHIHVESMQPNGISDTLGTERKLYWRYNYAEEMNQYVITILGQAGDLIVRESFTPGGYTGEIESWIIPPNMGLIHGEVYKWRIDTSGDRKSGIEIEGSESGWANFLYIQ
jgi:hypothetical protein